MKERRNKKEESGKTEKTIEKCERARENIF